MTGKTTYLSKQIEHAAEKHGSENVVVASYTKAAATVLNRRQLPIPRENIGTLHALCYRGLKQYEIAEINAKAFNEEYPGDEISLTGSGQMDELAVDAVYVTEGDKHLNTYNLFRAKCLELHTMPKNTIEWVKKWENWKYRANVIDFTDMINITLCMDQPMAGEPTVGIFDECFPEHICVTMSDGSQKPIGEIVNNQIHGAVLSFNEETGLIEEKQIVGWHRVPLNNRNVLSYGPLQATDNHPVFTKNGYNEFKKVVDLDCMEVLWLDYEKLQSEHSINSNRKIHYSRVTSWRRFNLEESGNERKCKSSVVPRYRTGRISELEIPKSLQVGTNTTMSSAKDGVWWKCLFFQHSISSGIYRILERNISQWYCKTKTNHSGDYKPIGCSGFSGMVHGRRRVTTWANYYQHIRFFNRRSEPNYRSFQYNGFGVQGVGGQVQGANFDFQCEWNNQVIGNHSTIHSFDVDIQDQDKGTQASKKALRSTGYFWKKISVCMPHLQRKIQTNKITDSLRQRFLLQKTNGQTPTGLAKKESSTRRNIVWFMCDLWKRIQLKTRKIEQQGLKYLRQTLPSDSFIQKSNHPQYVYCIDVENNHNFFANNILVHNCQDFNKLELKLVRHWAKYQDHIILSGDDDQTIYDFTGASPEAFLSNPIAADHKRVLNQSWRLPRKIHEFSQRWIKQIANREPKEFLPKNVEGNVSFINATYRTPNAAIELAARYAQDGKTVMLLASCGYLLNTIKTQLRSAGLPFWNPYRQSRGDWNPMGSFHNKQAGRISTRERILSFLSDSVSGQGYWSAEDLARWIELVRVKGILKKGAKDKIISLIDDQQGIIYDEAEFYAQIFEDFALEHAVARDLKWFKESLLSAKRTAVEYPLAVYGKQGRAALEEKPKIILGTIHSTKGGEADATIIFPDLSLAAMQDFKTNRDSTIRTFYVGITRSRESLVICQPASDMSVKFN